MKEMLKLKEELGVNEWLELCKEDKNLSGAYVSFGQYMYMLEKRLEEKEDDINKAIDFINNNMYEEYCYVDSEDKLKQILKRGVN